MTEGNVPHTYIVAVVTDTPPGPLSEHQQVHLSLHGAGAAQRLPAPVRGLPWV